MKDNLVQATADRAADPVRSPDDYGDSKLFKEHIEALEAKAMFGDEFAVTSLACMALLASGWRYGDADQTEGDTSPDDDGGIINLDWFRRAA